MTLDEVRAQLSEVLGPLGVADDAMIDAVAGAVAKAQVGLHGVRVEESALVKHLAACVGVAPARAYERAFVHDLAVALGCMRGDAAALAHLETLFDGTRPALKKRLKDDLLVDEVVQRLRVRIVVGDGASLPRLASYRGDGPLAAWLRMCAVRIAYNLLDEPDERASRAREDADLLDAAVGDAVERQILVNDFASHFREAMESAIGSLDPKSRTLLRLHHREGLTVDKIGAYYQVDRATAARWVSAARQLLALRMREAFLRAASLRASEYESVAHVLQSCIDFSVARMLAEAPRP
jgi:RNA polymerase sigma-70 factor (ECF subfamily)